MKYACVCLLAVASIVLAARLCTEVRVSDALAAENAELRREAAAAAAAKPEPARALARAEAAYEFYVGDRAACVRRHAARIVYYDQAIKSSYDRIHALKR